jgi:hypothetical protein
MPRTRSRGERTGIAFMVVWLVFWTAGILIAVWSMGAAALDGEPQAIVFLGVWVAAAGFGLYSGARRLTRLLFREREVPRSAPQHRWDDGLPPPPPPG